MPLSRTAALAGLAVLAASVGPTPGARAVRAVAEAGRPVRDYPVEPVPFTSVHLDDVFWRPRIETNRTESIPFAFEMCERTGRDTGRGDVRVPPSWRMLHRDGDQWKAVVACGPYGVEKDRYNGDR